MNLRVLLLVALGVLMATPAKADEFSFKDFTDFASNFGFTVKHLTGEAEGMDDKAEGEVAKDFQIESDVNKLQLEIEFGKGSSDESFLIAFAPKASSDNEESDSGAMTDEDDSTTATVVPSKTDMGPTGDIEGSPTTIAVSTPEPNEASLLFGGLIGLSGLALVARRRGKHSFRERMAL